MKLLDLPDHLHLDRLRGTSLDDLTRDDRVALIATGLENTKTAVEDYGVSKPALMDALRDGDLPSWRQGTRGGGVYKFPRSLLLEWIAEQLHRGAA